MGQVGVLGEALVAGRGADLVERRQSMLQLPERGRVVMDAPPPGAGEPSGTARVVLVRHLRGQSVVRRTEHPMQRRVVRRRGRARGRGDNAARALNVP